MLKSKCPYCNNKIPYWTKFLKFMCPKDDFTCTSCENSFSVPKWNKFSPIPYSIVIVFLVSRFFNIYDRNVCLFTAFGIFITYALLYLLFVPLIKSNE